MMSYLSVIISYINAQISISSECHFYKWNEKVQNIIKKQKTQIDKGKEKLNREVVKKTKGHT